jgi:aspartyl-tRNA(Asn)/glutamyl-tRNA(Gln) amidotransferase subunit A
LKPFLSLTEIRKEIDNGSLSCKKLVEHYLQNIKKKSHLNVFLEVFEEEAKKKADEIDQKIKSGKAGRLAGMVIGIKDVLCYKDHHLQCSSKILNGFVSQFTGTVVQKLIDEDAIIIGRQNCDEFAMGSSNENSAFGPVLNEIDNTRVPGGSSGGSAVAVQADLCMASFGSDTGGSVRQPAAFCGVFGLKPTYSRLSRWGLVAYSSSFDAIGIITNSIDDSALLLEITAGSDEFDSTVSHKPVPSYTQDLSFPGKAKIAYIKDTLESSGLNEEIKLRTIEKINQLKEAGHEVKEITFPLLEYILPTYYILTTAEASSNLNRYDVVKFGHRSAQGTTLETMYKKTRSEGFGEEVQRRIMLGTFVLSADYYDAYYTKAQKVRRLIKDWTDKIFADFDFIVLPTTPTTAFKLGEHLDNALEMYLADLFTVQANVVGIPAISVPNGKDAKGLPIGFQIMAKHFEEQKLLAFARICS